MMLTPEERLLDVVDRSALGQVGRVVDDASTSPSVLLTRYSTLGAVAMSARSNSRSRRSLTISMCSRPRKPQRNPKPSAPDDLRRVGDRGVVELQLLEALAQVLEVVAVDREQAAEHHRLRIVVALERLGGPVARTS